MAVTWSRVQDKWLARPLVISPHLDDAVLSCGLFLAAHPGTVVVTALAGIPPDLPVNGWDRRCGFRDGDNVMAARRKEDQLALAYVDAEPRWLDFCQRSHLAPDHQVDPAALAEAIGGVVDDVDPTAVAFPFGLGHPDHELTHAATMPVMAARPHLAWYCYEDLPYRILPGVLAARIRGFVEAGIRPTPAPVPLDPTHNRKLAAFLAYRSQAAPLDDDWGITQMITGATGEGWWRLLPDDGVTYTVEPG
jgi:LmbE family N-acetylglucosaminyl deacetylase